MLENAYKSIPAEVSLLMPFVLSITIKGANFIRVLNLNFQPFSYTLLVQDAIANYHARDHILTRH